MAGDDEVIHSARARLGQVLRGKYRLDAILGLGGMAVVYAAVHRNQKRFAIKMLRTELSLNTDLRQRFLREGYVANMVDDPGAVAVLDDDVAEDGAAFLVMELLRGDSIDRILERNPSGLPVDAVVAIANALLSTLAAAHAKSIVHRDIKPANLFVTDEGQLKVLDFGIARLRDAGSAAATSTGILLGTPAFMAPEQAGGHSSAIDGRTDLFAVGATLFTLLSGRLVHESGNAAQMMVRAATVQAPSVRTVRDVPPALAAVIDRALAFGASDRWPDAIAMRDALRAAATTELGAPPSTAPLAPLLRLLEARSGEVPSDPSSAALMKTELAPSTASVAPKPHASTAHAVTRTRPSARPPAARPMARPLAFGAAVIALAAGGWLFTRRHAAPAPVLPAVAPVPSSVACVPSCGQAAAPSVCRSGACVPIASQDCKAVADADDLNDDATVWIGTMFPLTGQASASFGQEESNAADLARRDFSQVAHGIVTKAGAARHVGTVACDDSVDPARAARHLVNDLHVPAVIGFYKSQEAIDLAREVFIPNGVVVLATNNHNPLVTAVPIPPGSPRLVWRACASSTQLAPPISAIVEDVIGARLRQEHALGAGEPVRVALIRGATATSLGFGDAIAVERSRVTGAAFEESFHQVVLDDDKPDVAGMVPGLIAFRPHVVIDEFDTEGSVDALRSIEKAWAHGAAPSYVVVDPTNDGLAHLVASAPELRKRVFSVESPANTANLRYALHYNEVYGTKGSARGALSTPYDAFYLLAYAAAAAEDPREGTSLARAIPLLGGPGKTIEVGETGIFDALNALHAGQHVSLVGTAGVLAFDPETGNRTADFAVTCFHAGADRAYEVESGMVYRATSGKLEGSLRCP